MSQDAINYEDLYDEQTGRLKPPANPVLSEEDAALYRQIFGEDA